MINKGSLVLCSISFSSRESVSNTKYMSQAPGRAQDWQNMIKARWKIWHQGLVNIPAGQHSVWSHISSRKASMTVQGEGNGSSVFSTSWTLCTFSFGYFFFSFIGADLTNKNAIHWRYTTWHFGICVHCEMITTFKLVNIFISSQLFCGCIYVCLCERERTLKFYPLSKFQVHNTVLFITVAFLYIRSPELFILNNWNFASIDHYFLISHTP